MRKSVFVVGTVFVLFGLMIVSAGATVVKVDPETQGVAAGHSFQVNIIVEDVVDMKADQAVLHFDPSAMQVTGITEGAFLKTGGNTIGTPDWDNTAGKAWFGYSLYGTWTPVSGDGILATVSFTADASAEGVFDLELTDIILIDKNNNQIPTGVSKGRVIISPVAVPGLSGTGMIAAIGILAIVLAISVGASAMRGRKK